MCSMKVCVIFTATILFTVLGRRAPDPKMGEKELDSSFPENTELNQL